MARVLVIVENLPVPLDRRVWQEAQALRDMGHEVTVICPAMRGWTEPEEVRDGIRILRHWIHSEAGTFGGYLLEYLSALWGELKCAVKVWRKSGFDVIHLCNPPDLLFLVALPFKILGGVRVVYDVHDLWPEMFQQKFASGWKEKVIGKLVRWAEWCTLRLADAVIATNESVRDTVMRRGKKPPEAVTVVRTSPNNLNPGTPPDPSLKRGRQHLVGYVGVMGSEDGVDFILRAAKWIKDVAKREDVGFLLMGGGTERENLLQLRESLDLGDMVEMPGRVSEEFLATGLATMDAGVTSDPINDYNDHCTMNKVLEYMVFGKPQVMFATKEGRRSAEGASLYVEENDPVKLGEAILRCLDDKEASTRMSEVALERIRGDLSWKNSVKNLSEVYAGL